MASWVFFGRSFHGVEGEACSACRALRASARSSGDDAFDHGAMAPLRKVASLSGMTRSGSMCSSTPRPSQAGQAPNGLLNENRRGSISWNGEAGDRAGELLGEDQPLGVLVAAGVGLGAGRGAVGELDHRDAVGELQALLQEFGEALGDVGAHDEAVHHDVDVVGELLVERRDLADLVELAVDLDALVALLEIFGQLLAVLALPAAHDRREHIDAGALGQRQDAVDHLRHGLALDRQAGGGRIGHADARPQEAHVVVDLGDGADGGARVLRGGLLLDGDRGREAVDLVDVRLLHHLQELPGVGRERLDVAALALGVDRVERERGFAGTRQAGDHHQLVARDLDVDVLEIVLARAADRNHAAVHRVFRRGTAGAGAPAFFEEIVHENPVDGAEPSVRNVVRTGRFRQSRPAHGLYDCG